MKESFNITADLVPLATPIDVIELDPRNAKEHSDAQLKAYAGSLREFGQRRPVVVNKRTGRLEAGEGLVKAALLLKWTHVAAIYVDDNPTLALGYALADNRIGDLGTWDAEALATNVKELKELDPALLVGFKESEIRDLIASLDDIPEPEEMEEGAAGKVNDSAKVGEPNEDGIRTYAVYVEAEEADDFDAALKALGKRWEFDNLSATVMRAVREAADYAQA